MKKQYRIINTVKGILNISTANLFEVGNRTTLFQDYGVNPPTGFEALDEGNGIGWRLIGRDPNKFGDIGKDAIDGSSYKKNYEPTTLGATGDSSVVFGEHANAPSWNEFAYGAVTLYTPNSKTEYNGGDRLFTIGVFTDQRNDAFTILKDLTIGIGYDNYETISNLELYRLQINGTAESNASITDINSSGNRVLITKEWLNSKGYSTISPTGFEKVGNGYRIIGEPTTNRYTIGNKSIDGMFYDASFVGLPNTPSAPFGVESPYSAVFGTMNKLQGSGGEGFIAGGNNQINNFAYGIALGGYNSILGGNGYGDVALGTYNTITATNENSFLFAVGMNNIVNTREGGGALGLALNVKSAGQVAVGQANVPWAGGETATNRPIFTVGIGSYFTPNGRWGANVPKDGFNVFKNGTIDMPSYGDGTITGTATYGAAFDANGKLIEVALGGGGASISDTVYGAGWNGDTTTGASKNAIFDKIESVIAGVGTGATPVLKTSDGTETSWDVINTITSGGKWFVDGVKLVEGIDYTKTGSTFTPTGYTPVVGHKWEYYPDIAVPTSGGGDMLLGTAQTVTAKKTFNTGMIGLRNPANTFSYNLLGSAITADRTLTLPLLTANDTYAVVGLAQTFTNKTLTSPVINTQISGTVTNGGNITTTNALVGLTATQNLSGKTLVDAVNNVITPNVNGIGYLGVPQNSKNTDYTLLLTDAGKHILHPSADTTARTFTIPANASVAFPIGTTISFVNQNGGGVITIAITTDTMRLAGAGTTGSRTLTANGIATAIKVTATEWLINGTNLS